MTYAMPFLAGVIVLVGVFLLVVFATRRRLYREYLEEQTAEWLEQNVPAPKDRDIVSKAQAPELSRNERRRYAKLHKQIFG